MKKIAILVDSTSGLTQKEADKVEGLFMIPLYFIFGEESYYDGIDLSIEEFFQKSEELYAKKQILPTTSQPSVGKTAEIYEEILKDYDHIIYYTLSHKMSGTYQSGTIAAEDFEGKVTVIDTETASAGQLEAAYIALEMVKQGSSIEEIVETTTKIAKDSYLLFVVDDLKHLQRTGRIGAAASAIGNALQLKPILTVENGEVNNVEKIRNVKKALKKIVSMFEEMTINDNDIIYVISAQAEEYGEYLKNELTTLYPNVTYKEVGLSPVVAVNTGPGTVGAVLIKK